MHKHFKLLLLHWHKTQDSIQLVSYQN